MIIDYVILKRYFDDTRVIVAAGSALGIGVGDNGKRYAVRFDEFGGAFRVTPAESCGSIAVVHFGVVRDNAYLKFFNSVGCAILVGQSVIGFVVCKSRSRGIIARVFEFPVGRYVKRDIRAGNVRISSRDRLRRSVIGEIVSAPDDIYRSGVNAYISFHRRGNVIVFAFGSERRRNGDPSVLNVGNGRAVIAHGNLDPVKSCGKLTLNGHGVRRSVVLEIHIAKRYVTHIVIGLQNFPRNTERIGTSVRPFCVCAIPKRYGSRIIARIRRFTFGYGIAFAVGNKRFFGIVVNELRYGSRRFNNFQLVYGNGYRFARAEIVRAFTGGNRHGLAVTFLYGSEGIIRIYELGFVVIERCTGNGLLLTRISIDGGYARDIDNACGFLYLVSRGYCCGQYVIGFDACKSRGRRIIARVFEFSVGRYVKRDINVVYIFISRGNRLNLAVIGEIV